MIHQDRLEAANKALKAFPIGQMFQFEIRNNRLAVWWTSTWTKKEPVKVSKVWQFQYDGSLWPKFDLPTGGTMTQALSQLVRWIKGQPVMPIGVFEWWDSPTVKLMDGEGAPIRKILLDAGYPETVKCVICGEKPKGLDWWSLDKLSGPCCSFGRCEDECKQKRNELRKLV